MAVADPSNVKKMTVTGLANVPDIILAESVTEPAVSSTVYEVESKPIVTPAKK